MATKKNSMVRFLSVLGMSLALSSAACLPASDDDQESEFEVSSSTALSLLLKGSTVEIVSARPSEAPIRQMPTRGLVLRWEFTDAAGDVVASGLVEDPRVLRAEFESHADHDLVGDVGALKLVVPGGAGVVRLYEGAEHGGAYVGEVNVPLLDPNEAISESHLINAAEDLLGNPQPLVQATGQSAMNLLVVAEGYTAEQMPQFHADAAALTQSLLALDGYAQHANEISIYRQDVKSDNAGIADPVAGVDPVTAFETGFGDDSYRPRRCVMYEQNVEAAIITAIRSRAEAVDANAIVILANTNEYGGCASPWTGVVTVTRHAEAARIVAHELAHTVFRLGDEYDGNQCGAYADAPNVASSLDALPWASMLTTSLLPTPLSTPFGTIGAFEGANHCSVGAYRPTHNCMMRELHEDFCPVCTAEIDRYFSGASLGQTGTMNVHNQTGADIMVRCPNLPGNGCSDWTHIRHGYVGTIQTNASGYAFYVDNSTVSGAPVSYSWKLLTPGASEVTVFANPANPLASP